MTLTFYPYSEDIQRGSLSERIEILMDAAHRYKAVMLDTTVNKARSSEDTKEGMIPRDQVAAYNWEEIARILKEIRDQPEGTKTLKMIKADYLTKLAEIYETLRAAKMSKLEAVRLALMSEANQLRGDASQVA